MAFPWEQEEWLSGQRRCLGRPFPRWTLEDIGSKAYLYKVVVTNKCEAKVFSDIMLKFCACSTSNAIAGLFIIFTDIFELKEYAE